MTPDQLTIFPRGDPPIAYESIHDGAWIARYKQASGKISEDEANTAVKEARIKRALHRSKSKLEPQ